MKLAFPRLSQHLAALVAFGVSFAAPLSPVLPQAGSNSTTTTDTTKKAAATSTDSSKRRTTKKRSTSTKKSTSASPPAHKPRIAPTNPGWPVPGPAPLPGSVLPNRRIVAFYGNPYSKRMGILGELPPDEMLAKLDREVAAWTRADSTTPVVPALHLIATVAQGDAGTDGMYRMRMPEELIERVYGWAKSKNALLFLDVQVGKSSLAQELPRFEKFLARPDVHLAIDPEFAMTKGGLPGKRIGTYDADDVNFATNFLAGIVDKYRLPPKVLVVHRFTRPMLTHSKEIKLDPRVQIVVNMDGWGAPWLKIDSYQAYVYSEPVQFTGFKLFYHNDTKKGNALMKPSEVLALFPKPVYIQYQ